MGKIVAGIGVFLSLVIIWQAVLFFTEVKEPVHEGSQKALQYLLDNIEVEEIIDWNFYHGTETYYVFQVTNNDEKLIIWVQEDLQSYTIKEQSSGLSYEEVFNFVETELQPMKLISIKLGMENTIPLYEIIYKDQKGRYSYYFIAFSDGSYLKNYHLGM